MTDINEILMEQVKALTESFTTIELDQTITYLQKYKKKKLENVVNCVHKDDIKALNDLLAGLNKQQRFESTVEVKVITNVLFDGYEVYLYSTDEEDNDRLDFDRSLQFAKDHEVTITLNNKKKLLIEYNTLFTKTQNKYKITSTALRKLLNIQEQSTEEYDEEEEEE